MAGQRDGFLADAFHQAAIACDHIGAVVHQIIAETRIEMALGHRHADGVGEALAKRTGGGLDAWRMAELRMAWRLRTELAEVLDLLACHLRIAGEIEQGVEQHRAVACRKDKPIPIWPVRGRGVELQEFLEQQGGAVGKAQRQAAMAALRLLDSVHAERPDRIGER